MPRNPTTRALSPSPVCAHPPAQTGGSLRAAKDKKKREETRWYSCRVSASSPRPPTEKRHPRPIKVCKVVSPRSAGRQVSTRLIQKAYFLKLAPDTLSLVSRRQLLIFSGRTKQNARLNAWFTPKNVLIANYATWCHKWTTGLKLNWVKYYVKRCDVYFRGRCCRKFTDKALHYSTKLANIGAMSDTASCCLKEQEDEAGEREHYRCQ